MIASSLFALVGVMIIGGTIYAYSYFSKRNEAADQLVKNAANLVNNKRQLAIEEVKTNLAQVRVALGTETDKLNTMRRIVGNDAALNGSIAGARIQAKIEAKRAALVETLKEWREELISVSSNDPEAFQAARRKYEEIITAHLAELNDLVNSPGSGLTKDEIALADDSISEMEKEVNKDADILSEPPINGDDVPQPTTDLPSADADNTTSDDGTNPTSSPQPSVSPEYPPPPAIIISNEGIEEQQELVDELTNKVGDLEDQLSNLEDNNGDTPTVTDEPPSDLPSPLPPQSRALDPNKPKLLQGSDL